MNTSRSHRIRWILKTWRNIARDQKIAGLSFDQFKDLVAYRTSKAQIMKLPVPLRRLPSAEQIRLAS